MLDGVKKYFKNLFVSSPKVNRIDAHDRQERVVRDIAEQTKRLEGIIGPLSEHPPVVVQQRSPSPNVSLASSSGLPSRVASGSNVSLVSQRPSQPPGTVPIRNALDLQNALVEIMKIIARSAGLEYDMKSLSDCCGMLTQLLNELIPEIKSTSKFNYEFTKMNQDLEDITRLLSEFNGKRAFRQGAARKETHLQIAKLSRDFFNHLGLFMAICQEHNSKLQRPNLDEIRDKMDALYDQAQQQGGLSNIDRDSKLKQRLEDVTGHEPQNSFILKGQIRYRESVAVSPGHNFDVYKGQMIDGEIVAIKLYRERLQNTGRGVNFIEYLTRSVALWTSFHHPSVLPCYGVGMRIAAAHETCPYPYHRLQFYLVSPFMRCGNAVRFIDTQRRNRVYVDILRIIRQAAMGIQYLHNREKPCAHGSLRGENVLIKDDGTACINGFGLTEVLYRTGPLDLTGVYPPYQWMAPELVWSHDPHPALEPSCDIWSWAMTALELIAGERPYHNFDIPWDICDAIIAGRTPNESDYPAFREYSPQPSMMWALLQKCWNMNPEGRPTIGQVIDELDLIEKAQIEEQLDQGHE